MGMGVGLQRKESEMNATTVAVDLAKSVFQVAVADANWMPIESHRLTRTQFERWFANREIGLVIMANRVAPTRIDAVNSAGSFMLAACSDWRSVGRFHVGTGQSEPTSDAGYTTACASKKPKLSISFLAFWGSPYTPG